MSQEDNPFVGPPAKSLKIGKPGKSNKNRKLILHIPSVVTKTTKINGVRMDNLGFYETEKYRESLKERRIVLSSEDTHNGIESRQRQILQQQQLHQIQSRSQSQIHSGSQPILSNLSESKEDENENETADYSTNTVEDTSEVENDELKLISERSFGNIKPIPEIQVDIKQKQDIELQEVEKGNKLVQQEDLELVQQEGMEQERNFINAVSEEQTNYSDASTSHANIYEEEGEEDEEEENEEESKEVNENENEDDDEEVEEDQPDAEEQVHNHDKIVAKEKSQIIPNEEKMTVKRNEISHKSTTLSKPVSTLGENLINDKKDKIRNNELSARRTALDRVLELKKLSQEKLKLNQDRIKINKSSHNLKTGLDKSEKLFKNEKLPTDSNSANHLNTNEINAEYRRTATTTTTTNANETNITTDPDDDNSLSYEIKLEMETLIDCFPGLSSRYKLLDKIGEGTFSTVYKAQDLQSISDKNSGHTNWNSPPVKKRQKISSSNSSPNFDDINQRRKESTNNKIPIVALKRIYVTSSPQRIYNELQLLHSLVGCPNVAPLIDAIRHEDQVIAVLPYYRHADFRDFYRDLPLSGIKIYMFELFNALSFVHEKKILHRDIKPTNFLYNPFTRRGMLVDFGLAERENDIDYNTCPCFRGGLELEEIAPVNAFPSKGYLKDDQRPGRRANRAGTRGFRAPEVLFKCPNQTTKVDIWSAGVMLLTLLARRFPFFNSIDDIDALIEITTIFGIEPMKSAAKLHGLVLDSNIPKLEGLSLGKIIYKSIWLEAKEGDTLAEDSPAWEIFEALDKRGKPKNNEIGNEYKQILKVLENCLKLNHNERLNADEILKLEFFKEKKTKIQEEEDLNDILLD
ncbi:hypothetical protein B5S33_g3148 [[Candida] boidinii]|nr:hypothetical protein B5S33_g3148 [[Candida] boidinii]